MRIGRLSFGIGSGESHWGYEKASCECCILELGRIYFVLLAKSCRCGICNQYECECPCPLCGNNYTRCDCEKFK